MSADVTLRLARPEDALDFHRVESDAAKELAGVPELRGVSIPPAVSETQHAKTIAKGRSLTASVGNEIVGFAAVRPERRELHLSELSVARRFQRRGVGTMLLRALIVDGRNSGFRAITLTTFRDVAWNAPFYARLGFMEIEDLEGHARLASLLDEEAAIGMPRHLRCAMIRFIE